jgi:hypothetical protein
MKTPDQLLEEWGEERYEGALNTIMAFLDDIETMRTVSRDAYDLYQSIIFFDGEELP